MDCRYEFQGPTLDLLDWQFGFSDFSRINICVREQICDFQHRLVGCPKLLLMEIILRLDFTVLGVKCVSFRGVG